MAKLDEISKDLASRYMSKAKKDKKKIDSKLDTIEKRDSNRFKKYTDLAKKRGVDISAGMIDNYVTSARDERAQERDDVRANSLVDRHNRRSRGIALAKKKLKEDTEELVNNIMFGDAADAKQIFDDILKNKIADRVASFKDEVAERMFDGEEEEEEIEDEEVALDLEDDELELEDLSDEELEMLNSLSDEEIADILSGEVEDDDLEDEDDESEEE